MVEVDERAPFYRRRPCLSCCCVIFAILLLLIIILIILAFTVFKPKDADITVSNIALDDFDASLRQSGVIPTPSVNVTLSFDVTIHNPNRASIKYTNSSASLYYHDDEVGVVPIPAGRIGSQDTSKISTKLVVLADKLITNSHLVGDFLGGSLPFQAQTKLSGRVKVLFIKKHVDILSTCNVIITIANASLANQGCDNKVHL